MSDLRLVGAPARKLPHQLYRIKYAEITDTRLMGVLGMHICWEAVQGPELESYLKEKDCSIQDFIALYHQIFYYEVEESGLETVTEIWGDDQATLTDVKNRFFGGLGCSQMLMLTENEALWMIKRFVEDTRGKHGSTEIVNADDEILESSVLKDGMPQSLEDLYEDLKDRELLGELERHRLMTKICAPIRNECAAINYYLMRSFGHDREGAGFVSAPLASPRYLKPVELSGRAVLRKNSIQLRHEADGGESYLCESLLECSDGFYVAFSELELADKRVTASKLNASFKISDLEAARKLRRPEYIAFFELVGLGEENPEDMMAEVLPKASRKFFETGVLYMDYNSDNDHVEKPVYNLADDVMASYFLTDTDQLVVASSEPGHMMSTELLLRMSSLGKHLEARGRYNFAHPLLGDFIDSGYDDFYEYLKNIM
jgi:hypothetical protein